MTMRNKLWTTIEGTTVITVANQPGNKGERVGANLLTGLGIFHLAGWTMGPSYLNITVHNSDSETGTLTTKAHVGLLIADGAQDDGDFPNLQFGDGDYFLRHSMIFDGAGAINVLVKPDQRFYYNFVSRSSRRLERIGDTIFLVFQHNRTAGFEFQWALTMMGLAP